MLGLQLPLENKVPDQQNMNLVLPQETAMGLKLINPLTKETRLLHFSNQHLLLDWNDFLEKKYKEEHTNFRFTVKGDTPSLVVRGNIEQLTLVYNYCVGKYIFSKGTSLTLIKIIKKDNKYQVQKVQNNNDKRTYFEKVLLQDSLQNLNSSFDSYLTECPENSIPEEIQIILDLHRCSTPYLLRVSSIFYDGFHYSYIYSKKDIIELIQYFKGTQQDNNCLIIMIARQLLQLLIVLEQKQLIFPTLSLKNIYINPITHEIMLMDYSQAFYLNNQTQNRRNGTFGYAPPEYFQQGTKTTTKANIFQAGVILFYLVFGHSPYGADSQEVVKNTLQNTLNIAALQIPDSPLTKFILLFLESDPKKRQSARMLLSHSIFTPTLLERFSKMSLTSNEKQDIKQEEVSEEFSEFNSITNIQRVKAIFKK